LRKQCVHERSSGVHESNRYSLWSLGDLNPWPLACHASALPTELKPRLGTQTVARPGTPGDAEKILPYSFGSLTRNFEKFLKNLRKEPLWGRKLSHPHEHDVGMQAANVWSDPWGEIQIPVVNPSGWSRPDVHLALASVELLARKVEAARCALICALGTGERDTAAVVARSCRISSHRARKHVKVASVVERVDGAQNALQNGDVGPEHLASLVPIENNDAAGELLIVAANESPEDFAKTVQRHRVDSDPNGLRAQQKQSRTASFYRTRNGCIGFRAVLPPLEGEEFRNRLWQLVDANWRTKHPDRAKTLGAHGDATFNQRCADALIVMSQYKLRAGSGAAGKTTLLLNVNLESLNAEVVGGSPVSLSEIADWLDRADIYAVIRDMHNIPIRFGRSKRLATEFQKLLLAAISGGSCSYVGCDQHWSKTKAHHIRRWDEGGSTDLVNLELLCDAHHRHHHLVDEPGDTRPLRNIEIVHCGRGPPNRANC
jgi:hypothetical protein